VKPPGYAAAFRGLHYVRRRLHVPQAPLRFQVLVNGKPIAITGTSTFGVLTTIVNWVRRDPAAITDELRKSPNFDEVKFSAEVCELELSALDSITKRHASWGATTLRPGDEVTVRILPSGEYDDPPPPPNKSLERTHEK
jgi:hypothetical protein